MMFDVGCLVFDIIIPNAKNHPPSRIKSTQFALILDQKFLYLGCLIR